MSKTTINSFRRKVLRGYRTNCFGSNLYIVELSCGHKNQTAQGFKDNMPKSSKCFACEKETKNK